MDTFTERSGYRATPPSRLFLFCFSDRPISQYAILLNLDSNQEIEGLIKSSLVAM